MKKLLFEQTDNAPLVVFRIFLGLLLVCETIGAIITGWVKANFIDPEFTFSHIGMEWLQPLPGTGMYIYFCIMSFLGACIMLGYKYRYTMPSFTLLWAGVYFMQKTSYNNHYYLLLLVCIMMCFLPAHRYKSIDAAQKPEIIQYSMPAWCRWVMVTQISIVYLYAAIAKLYPEWINGSFTYNLLSNMVKESELREILVHKNVALFIAWAGIFFDLLVVPLLLWKKTRMLALLASLAFHIFNSLIFKIGIFPFFALAFVVFMYPPETIRRLFLKRKARVFSATNTIESKTILYIVFIPFLVVQFILPIRHYFIPGDVLWTEEGHRLSWRMMLRSRAGTTQFTVKNKTTGAYIPYTAAASLTQKQHDIMQVHPDMIWQMAQHIKKTFAQRGISVAVYANSEVSVNNMPYRRLINPDTDLAAAKWHYFGHCPWILTYPTTTGNR